MPAWDRGSGSLRQGLNSTNMSFLVLGSYPFYLLVALKPGNPSKVLGQKGNILILLVDSALIETPSVALCVLADVMTVV